MNSLFRTLGFCALALVLFCTGCTSRGLTVTSEPPGAEVSINRRVVGKTPIRVSFNHYGTYRIELRKEGFKVLVREEPVRPPIYGYDPVALVADNGSTDGTRDVLAAYQKTGRLAWVPEADPGYHQNAWMTRLAHRARAEHGADWLVFADADEFWCPAGGGSL